MSNNENPWADDPFSKTDPTITFTNELPTQPFTSSQRIRKKEISRIRDMNDEIGLEDRIEVMEGLVEALQTELEGSKQVIRDLERRLQTGEYGRNYVLIAERAKHDLEAESDAPTLVDDLFSHSDFSDTVSDPPTRPSTPDTYSRICNSLEHLIREAESALTDNPDKLPSHHIKRRSINMGDLHLSMFAGPGRDADGDVKKSRRENYHGRRRGRSVGGHGTTREGFAEEVAGEGGIGDIYARESYSRYFKRRQRSSDEFDAIVNDTVPTRVLDGKENAAGSERNKHWLVRFLSHATLIKLLSSISLQQIISTISVTALTYVYRNSISYTVNKIIEGGRDLLTYILLITVAVGGGKNKKLLEKTVKGGILKRLSKGWLSGSDADYAMIFVRFVLVWFVGKVAEKLIWKRIKRDKNEEEKTPNDQKRLSL